ncbi:hypothetical protein CathTA2_0007 [Caldalkalibacillus thermarum TA2.A1]|uniref:Uncharacterized protein n=2 Tax=Caldalkalibacillus thermarum (strain TA2.A1) TaxID=986075 RepID=F5L6D1_CALTT|nr:hypothetical protein [Caldalkalibacillus thermarum]EGL83102.1 hypothetical protein CathTA2_0013 [Caldalkalibacillus thermarum TA2.A1]EGL84270.1 hypothetical protein CathTA2_0007 [Caldalkalibacillus thermarum TA2.A1]QZT33889.1 hypothetical protein HUR95_17105 [Caldalkalibacillus thermarum TA2.A1]GGK27402.1 hypothetical protein GCM10010965_20290 [Caldalkalibacillus thermarum]
MEHRQYPPADLPPQLLEKLKAFEEEMRQQTGENIVLIAYEEQVQTEEVK